MSCSQTLCGIATDCKPSMGGVAEVYIANKEDVSAVTVTDNKVTAITMAASAKFKKYSFRRGTGSLTSTLTADAANGVSYVTSELVLQFNRMETTKRVEINALAVNEMDVIVKDCNGAYWFLGYDEGVFASAGDGQTGTARSDANRYSITLQDNSHEFPYEVSEGVLDSIL